MVKYYKVICVAFCFALILQSCSSNEFEKKEEQIRALPEDATSAPDSVFNSVQGNVAMSQLATSPNSVILTGMPAHRLVSVYKASVTNAATNKKYYYSYDGTENEMEEHFMPGIDILYGYNLLNIAHFDIKSERLNYLFSRPSLIKTVYYPAFEQDSIDKKPINRNFFLVSVYDEDTNGDTLINRKDLRRFYLFDSTCVVKTQLIPADYNVVRSQYDSQNDLMYVFAKQDENKNGAGDQDEKISVFWFSLKAPGKAKRLY